MPFDSASPLPPSLFEAARRLGIVPVPDDVLSRHKQAELAKYPGNWWYSHQRLAESAFPILASLCIGTLMDGLHWTHLIVAVAIFGLLVRVTKGFVVKGPARWVESQWSLNMQPGIPRSIADLAKHLQGHFPDSDLRLGKLVQDSVVLDPYLLLCQDDEQIVLGIWDAAGVIQQAIWEDAPNQL